MKLTFTGTFDELKDKLKKIPGKWEESETNKKVFRIEGGILNWFDSTGTIQFQGKLIAKNKLEQNVKHALYPSDYSEPTDTYGETEHKIDKEQELETDKDIPVIEENKYLKDEPFDSEILFGIVNSVGTKTKQVIDSFTNRIKGFGYTVKEIRVSSLLKGTTSPDNEYERIRALMKAGDKLRADKEDNSILAAGVAKLIKEERTSGVSKTVYIINSLKHPDEIALLRKIYGQGFFLLGIHSDEKRRLKYLQEEKLITQKNAAELIRIDEDENISHGQRTRDTYHLADFFINLGDSSDQVDNTLQRFLDLIFSHPYKNPTFDEFAMFMAFNSSIRSSDLSRQVGAVLCKNKQILATGANDCPKFGGGQYWAERDSKTGEVNDIPDGKDYTRHQDSNKSEQHEIISSIISNVKDELNINESDVDKLKKILKKSRISDLTEFGRVVHAEMESLLSCSREGISTIGTTLYCTTFPCHNCAKHIINAGVKRVVYVEPYPKSKALELHSESIHLKTNPEDPEPEDKVIFEPFTGAGARRFLDIFSMHLGSGCKLKRKDKEGNTLEWKKEKASPRIPLISKSYLEIEEKACKMFDSE